MADIIERTQQEAVRRLLNGQHSRTFYDGAHFAATITPEQVEAAAQAYLEAGPSRARWLLAMEHIRESVRERIRAAFIAAGFHVE